VGKRQPKGNKRASGRCSVSTPRFPAVAYGLFVSLGHANRHSCRCGKLGSGDAAPLALLPNHCLDPAFSKDQVVVVVLAA